VNLVPLECSVAAQLTAKKSRRFRLLHVLSFIPILISRCVSIFHEARDLNGPLQTYDDRLHRILPNVIHTSTVNIRMDSVPVSLTLIGLVDIYLL
jgi:hypothetical protein